MLSSRSCSETQADVGSTIMCGTICIVLVTMAREKMAEVSCATFRLGLGDDKYHICLQLIMSFLPVPVWPEMDIFPRLTEEAGKLGELMEC